MSRALKQLDAINQELERRTLDPIKLYRPQPQQLPIHESPATECIVRGGKRAGKTLALSAEFRSRITGDPIIRDDGTPIKPRFPVPTPKRPKIYWIIGWDVKHIGQTIYKMLFEPGMGGTLKAIKDPLTGKWRIFNRANPWDAANEKQAKLTEPWIPSRLIKKDSWTWNSTGGGKTAHNFESVQLVNGAKIFAYPSSSRNPKQGDAVSGIWIDEDIQQPEHLKEWQDRLGDENGWFMWSVWPHTRNFALADLIQRADDLKDNEVENPSIVSHQLVFSQNQFITEKGRKAQLERMGDADEIARRDRGELMSSELAMYDYGLHHLIRLPRQGEEIDTKTARGWLRNRWSQHHNLPAEWTRYLAVDPSNTRTAVVSGVVPPPEYEGVRFGDMLIIEWELVLKKASAEMLANELAKLMRGIAYEAFIMDQNMGRQTNTGRDNTVFDCYEDAFRSRGLRSRQSHSGFIPGCNVPSRRHREVRDAMTADATGTPQLLLIEDRTAATQREFVSYRKKQSYQMNEWVTMDEPANPRKYDCMSAVEYLVTHVRQLFSLKQAYVPGTRFNFADDPIVQQVKRMKERQKSQQGRQYVSLGPGSSQASNAPALSL